MKKIINKKNNKNEPWFKWLTRELNSYEAFQDFESGKNPRDVAEDFICLLYTSPSPRDLSTSRMPSSA